MLWIKSPILLEEKCSLLSDLMDAEYGTYDQIMIQRFNNESSLGSRWQLLNARDKPNHQPTDILMVSGSLISRFVKYTGITPNIRW